MGYKQCKVCLHPERENIEKMIIQGVTYREISAKYGMSHSAIMRHKKGHMVLQVKAGEEKKEIEKARRRSSLLEDIHHIKQKAEDILDTAERAGSLQIALNAIRELRSTIELMAKIEGELQSGVTINVSPQWVQLRQVIIQAVSGYPEAKEAIVAALSDRLTDGS